MTSRRGARADYRTRQRRTPRSAVAFRVAEEYEPLWRVAMGVGPSEGLIHHKAPLHSFRPLESWTTGKGMIYTTPGLIDLSTRDGRRGRRIQRRCRVLRHAYRDSLNGVDRVASLIPDIGGVERLCVADGVRRAYAQLIIARLTGFP
jgi:hypothetical protein